MNQKRRLENGPGGDGAQPSPPDGCAQPHRRRFLRRAGGVGAIGIAGMLGGGTSYESVLDAALCRSPAPGLSLFGGGATHAASVHAAAPAQASADFHPDVEIDLAARIDDIALLPGAPTSVWRYEGRVVRGAPEAFSLAAGSRHIPVLRVRRGQKLRVNFTNALREASVVHWHGLNIAQRMDGHPMYAVGPGQRIVYEFPIENRAGTYWFHPHPHGRTGAQVYGGLAGLLLIGDEEEDAATLPQGELDVALVLQDRTFDANNQLVYLGRGMMERMMGFVGERLLVNGTAAFALDVRRAAYRLRLFNGSNATTYRLAWSDARPLTIIGTDGGLLEKPHTQRHLTLAPAQRADLWVDFATQSAGDELTLLAEPFSPMLERGLARSTAIAVAAARLRVTGGAGTPSALPERLATLPRLDLADATNRNHPRRFALSMMRGQATINGRAYEMESVADDEKVRLGDTELWEFSNDAPMGMRMAHPMHVHNVSFRVIDRTGPARAGAAQRALAEGLHDGGLQDTVLVLPGERVRVLMKFERHPGLYLYHCHVLEHEDLGMMRNFRIDAA